MAAVPDPEVQFAQRLASNEKPIRTRALKKLRKYINLRSQKASGGFTADEVLKLWKGLFYCLWMQDKPLLQEELSHQISSLIHSFQDVDGQIIYVRSFLQTFKREWTGLDRLRMDKFFQLVRFMFRKTFEMLQRRNWDSSVVSRFLDLLTEQLLQGSSGAPCGLQLHILDLYLSELATVGSAELTADQNLIFIEPFCKTAAKTKDRTLFSAICRSVFSAIIEQAPFAIEDLMKEVKAAEASDPGSGQSSDDEDKETGETRSNICEKKTNGIKSNDEDDEELLHLEDSDTEAPCDGDMEPVLQFDYAAVAEKLFALSSRSDMPSYNRKGLYKIIRVLRNLSEGVFPEDEYPEEVSTDEDDDMFGSRKRMKRGRGLMEGEEGPPESKRSKGNKKEPSADMNNNDENKKKKKKKKKKKAAEAGESTNSSEKEQNSVNVSENATAEDQSETPLQEPPSLPAREEPDQPVPEEPDQPTAHTTDTEEKSETKSKKKTSGLKIAEEQQMIPSDAGVSEKKKKMKKKKKNQIGSETQVSARDEAAPSENGTTTQAKKNAEEKLEVNGVSLEEDSTTSGKKKSKKKKKPMSDKAEKVEAKNIEPETTPAAENPSADATAAPPVKKKKTKQEKNSLEAADEGSVPPLKKKKRKKQEEPAEEQHITKTTSAKKKASSAKHEVRDQDPAQDAEVPLEEPEKPAKKKKRKIPVVFEYEAEELEASINGAAEEERAGEEDPPPATPLSSRKSSRKAKASGSSSDFITFQSNAAVPTPLFCRTKGGPLRQRRQTPKSDSKKVTFGLKNNKTAEFKKNDRSLLVSPDGSSRVPFDPKQKPKFGVLKSPSPPLSAKTRKTPKGTRKAGATVAKARPKARPTAADFF